MRNIVLVGKGYSLGPQVSESFTVYKLQKYYKYYQSYKSNNHVFDSWYKMCKEMSVSHRFGQIGPNQNRASIQHRTTLPLNLLKHRQNTHQCMWLLKDFDIGSDRCQWIYVDRCSNVVFTNQTLPVPARRSRNFCCSSCMVMFKLCVTHLGALEDWGY